MDKKKSLENHFPVTSPQTAQTNRAGEHKPVYSNNLNQSLVLQMQRIPPPTAISCQADKSFTHKLWHCSQYVFVFPPSLTTAQFSWQPWLVCCFFLETGQVWLFWQHRLPYHLIVSSKLWCSPAWAAAAVLGGDGMRLGSHHSLLMHAAQVLTAGATTASTGRIQLCEATAAGLHWFTDSAGTSKGEGWCLPCHIQDDCQKCRRWKK